MKRLVIASIEIDGHSSSSCFIASNEENYQKIIHDLICFEDEPIYTLTHTDTISPEVSESWYEGDLGEMSVLVIEFSAFGQICNKEFYTRTG